ncbi:DNAJC10 (predicted) [Pycnogonum litorale]
MRLPKLLIFYTLCIVTFLLDVCFCENFYELLNVNQDADIKEIRRAFKKLALTLHPDKNVGDKDAHENFIRINRAYEVLKDEDLRKKYDMFGEDGLDENKQRWGSNFHSWKYYKEDFGIYDDDAEIVTLGHSDFDQSVRRSPDTWFINFYSPRCSHCHTLAPIWRKVARELEGVVRIGAVNCGEDWGLCQQENIHSYPYLMLYPQRVKYPGERTVADLVYYIMKSVPNKVVKITDGNMESGLKLELPWLVFFCNYDEECMSPDNKKKLAVILDDMLHVGDVDCTNSPKVCKKFNKQFGIFFYANLQNVERYSEIDSLDIKDITNTVLNLLPEIKILDEEEFKSIRKRLDTSHEAPWLIYFLDGAKSSDTGVKKLPSLLNNMNVGMFDCTTARTMCNSIHVHKFPAFVVFKTGGGREIYHGRINFHDIAAFARESGASMVKTLDVDDFPHIFDDDRPWFIDFYAPWCPPCLQLLPEWRKASKVINNLVNFGTVDCTIHQKLCNMYNIRAYPTAILYNNSVPYQFHGQKNSKHIVDFVTDILNPTVISLDSESFDSNVRNKGEDVMWIIDFYSPHCGPCQQLAPEWRKLAQLMKNHSIVRVGQVDCTVHQHMCSQEGIRSYPSIRLYPLEVTGSSTFHSYDGWNRDVRSIRSWMFEWLPSIVTNLNHNQFMNDVLPDTKPWLIDFYAPWCGPCQVFAPIFETVAEAFKGRVNVAKVNCDRMQLTCQTADVNAYPTVKFYAGAQHGLSQNMWGDEIGNLDADYIISYVQQKLDSIKFHSTKDEL